jgi:hypothetical protein
VQHKSSTKLSQNLKETLQKSKICRAHHWDAGQRQRGDLVLGTVVLGRFVRHVVVARRSVAHPAQHEQLHAVEAGVAAIAVMVAHHLFHTTPANISKIVVQNLTIIKTSNNKNVNNFKF